MNNKQILNENKLNVSIIRNRRPNNNKFQNKDKEKFIEYSSHYEESGDISSIYKRTFSTDLQIKMNLYRHM